MDIKNNTQSVSDKYGQTKDEFVAYVISKFQENEGDISERNARIARNDGFVYGDLLKRSITVPLGHDYTEVNWLRRTVEIHNSMFMSRGFMVNSSYDSQDIDVDDPKEVRRLQIENDKNKSYAELRKQAIDAIIRDNGGFAQWALLAESAGVAGDAVIKGYYDVEQDKYVLSPIEAIENVRVIWSSNDFRSRQATGYVYQITKADAIRLYNVPEDTPTTPLGTPMDFPEANAVQATPSQPMVTVIEATGTLECWGAENGKIKKVSLGKENQFNFIIVGKSVVRVVDNPKKVPKFYILPNKRVRRRPWGMPDITEAAIYINATYIETLSDWRTVAAKVNFPKYKAFGFGKDTQMPKPTTRQVQIIPLADGQDIVPLGQEDANQIDFRAQMDELKEQFVRESGISRVLFDDPSVTLNSNQALLTSLKPSSDIAEKKKQLWQPIIIEIFQDALETIALYNPAFKELVSTEDNWALTVQWPSVLQKEDPTYQSMLLNRFNAGLLSVQSYMEAQGDSQEEIDRIQDELRDPVTAAILGKALPLIAQAVANAGTAEIQAWYQLSMPQQETQGQGNTPGVDSNGGAAAIAPTSGTVEGGVGLSPVSQPGTGATAASPGGALAQANQNAGG